MTVESGVTLARAMVAIQVDTGLWARPVAWRGRGEALAFHPGHRGPVVVPSDRGGDRWWPSFDDLTGAWDVVTPDTIRRSARTR